jgi:antitoxin component YwqK of YwqJK toxin-antitoxin module
MYHENGQVEKRGHVEDGKEEGLWEHYFKNGQFYKLIKVRVGPKRPDGLSELFYEDGLLKEKGDYKDGELEGPQERFYENGQLEYRGKYKTGQRDGTWMYFDEEGNLTKTEEWENEKLIK